MSEIIDLGKTTFSRKNFEKVVDNRFKQLLNNRAAVDEVFTIDDFFQLYDDLFFQIPKEGEIQSHRFILNQTAEHLGININDGTSVSPDDILSKTYPVNIPVKSALIFYICFS